MIILKAAAANENHEYTAADSLTLRIVPAVYSDHSDGTRTQNDGRDSP
jgi:hypothetical protein